VRDAKGAAVAALCKPVVKGCGEGNMNQSRLENIVKEMAEQSKGEAGMVEFRYQGMNMYLISDVNHDRMRIITPVADYPALSRDQIDRSLEANFHTALDARYAVSNDVLYAAYIHPLSELSGAQIKSAVAQVFSLAATFGGDYSSGLLRYGGGSSSPVKLS
jgi:hypothetical protein